MTSNRPTFILDNDADDLFRESLQRSASGSQVFGRSTVLNRSIDGHGTPGYSSKYSAHSNHPTDSSTEQNSRGEENEIVCSTATKGNVLHLMQLQLRHRRAWHYEWFHGSLAVASKSLETLRMISHLERVVRVQSTSDKAGDPMNQTLKHLLAEGKARLSTAVNEQDLELILSLEGEMEKLMLKYDIKYIEQKQKAKYVLKIAVKENHAPCPPPSWLQDFPYRLLSLMRGDRTGEKQRVFKGERRWWVLRTAWLISVTLMILAVAFISLDFYKSKKTAAVSSKMLQHDRLVLPIVWGCMSYAFFPTFLDLAASTDYVGEPVLALRHYSNYENGEELHYPMTHEQVAEDVIIGPGSVCDVSMRYLSLQNILDGLTISKDIIRCFSCYRVGKLKPVWVDRSSSLNREREALSLQFAIQFETEFCFQHTLFTNSYLREVLLLKLLRHSSRLVEKGALVLLDSPGGAAFALKYGFLHLNSIFGRDEVRRYHAEVYCNLYWFSDVFYPVRPGEAVRYSFNLSAGREAWVRLDSDSFYLNVRQIYNAGPGGRFDRPHYLKIMHNVSVVSKTSYAKPAVVIYSIDKMVNFENQPGIMDFSTHLRAEFATLLLYRKTIEQGVAWFSKKVYIESNDKNLVLYPHKSTNLSLDFESFQVQVIKKVATTTLVEFFSDLFEYIGLFTGICAYSLLVSPARMYLRRTQTLRSTRVKG